MTEVKRMNIPRKSLDVFEFREEDELDEIAVKKSFTKTGHTIATVSRIGIQFEEIETGICTGTATDLDYNNDTTGSPTVIETKDFSRTPCLSNVLHNGVKSHVQTADIESNVSDSRCNVVGMDTPACLGSDADDSMSEKSPSAIATSSEGTSSHNCFSGWDLDDETVWIVFYTDYLKYCGTHYLDSVVRFSRSFIKAQSKTIYGKERNFHIHLELEDIVKIESQWSARYTTGTINIHFISKDAAEDNIIHNASGIQELNFPAVDSDWHKKQEAIESLDVRYKALWSVLLDTGVEKCAALPEGEEMVTRSYVPHFNVSFQEVIYPKGDPDAVSIYKRDVDLLQPDTFVNDTIIDFYIKYLKTRMNAEEQNKFHFFNSFFFRKLAEMAKDSSSAFDGTAAFQLVRRWTRKVDLLEKDFIFIPVNYNYHWSLIVICYFGEVASYEDAEDKNSVRVPCILHMDSLRGSHIGLKDLMQSYLWEEWKERQKGTCEELCSKFRNLKFIPLELPQQQNSYDCGLFLLHYVELFLEDVPANFSIYKIAPSSKFLQADWFPPSEASMKRVLIGRLINDLIDTHSTDCTPSGGGGMQSFRGCPNTTHGYENGVEFSVKPPPSQGCHESSLCEVGQKIEMNFGPDSSKRSTHTTGFYSSELFDQASTVEALANAPWAALGNKASSHEHKTEDDKVEILEPFMPTELAEAFHHLDATQVTPETYACALPSSCGDFTPEMIGISDQSTSSCFLNSTDNFNPKPNQLHDTHSFAFMSSDKSGKLPHPIHMLTSSVPISTYPLATSHERNN